MSEAVDSALKENHELIAAILHHNAAGRHVPAVQLLERLQTNLQFIAAVADHGLPLHPTPLPANLLPAQQHHQHPQPSQPQSLPHQQQLLPHIGPSAQPQSQPMDISTAAVVTATTLPPIPLQSVPTIAPATSQHPEQQQQEMGLMFWSQEEHAKFEHALRLYGTSGKNGRPNFKAIASHVATRTPVQVRNHYVKLNTSNNNDNNDNNDNINNNNLPPIMCFPPPPPTHTQASPSSSHNVLQPIASPSHAGPAAGPSSSASPTTTAITPQQNQPQIRQQRQQRSPTP